MTSERQESWVRQLPEESSKANSQIPTEMKSRHTFHADADRYLHCIGYIRTDLELPVLQRATALATLYINIIIKLQGLRPQENVCR